MQLSSALLTSSNVILLSCFGRNWNPAARVPGASLKSYFPCFEERKNQATICAAVPKLHENMDMHRGSPAPLKFANNFSTYRPIHTESPNEYCRKYLSVHR